MCACDNADNATAFYPEAIAYYLAANSVTKTWCSCLRLIEGEVQCKHCSLTFPVNIHQLSASD